LVVGIRGLQIYGVIRDAGLSRVGKNPGKTSNTQPNVQKKVLLAGKPGKAGYKLGKITNPIAWL